MHDNHIRLSTRQQCMIHDVRPAHALKVRFALEPLLLHARDVQHVRVREHFVERVALVYGDTCFARGCYDAFGHSEGGRGDEVEPDGVEGEQRDEAVYCAPVLQVSEQSDGAPVDCSQLGTDGEDVQKRLKEIISFRAYFTDR